VPPSGEILTNVTSDTNTLKDVLGGNLFDFAGQVVTLAGMFAVLFWLNWKLSLAVLFTFPLLVWSIFSMYRRTKLSARTQRHREGQLASRISEVLGSVLLVRAFARESYEQHHFNEESSRTLDESVRTARMEGAAARTIEIINSLGIWVCGLFGSLLALRREMIVLGRGKPFPRTAQMTEEQFAAWDGIWRAFQEELAKRSPHGQFRLAADSGYFIQIDQPELVIQAIRDLIRTH
jgi:ABC-type multidrug transport system fused ATPase/permease subunit